MLLLLGISARGRSHGIGLGGKDVRKQLNWITIRPNENMELSYGSGDYGRRLRLGGRDRFYEIHVPSQYDRSKPTPVVLVFHGGGGYPAAVCYQSGMDRVSDREGFIAVYPAGTGKLFDDRLLIWNDGRRYKNGSSMDADDVGFVAALLDDLATLFNVDERRVYACGISNGAQFSYRLAKQLTDRIAAIATVGGQRPAGRGLFPSPAEPMPVMQFSGKQDIYAPFDGGQPHPGKGLFKVRIETQLESVEEVIRSWVNFNHCPSEPADVKRVGRAIAKRYGPGEAGAEVVLWILEDGGHTWPGGQVLPAEVKAGVGHINHDISASELMWEFFKKHQRESDTLASER
jgi:polyhydroxybutyrate depolymerase